MDRKKLDELIRIELIDNPATARLDPLLLSSISAAIINLLIKHRELTLKVLKIDPKPTIKKKLSIKELEKRFSKNK